MTAIEATHVRTDGQGAPDRFDVVVVGGGNAGMMAAIEAAEAGASVVILQKLPEAGGKSSLAIGSISAAGTSMQRARGIEDDHDRHWADLCARIAAGGIEPLSMQRLELAVRHGAEALERLIGLGVHFSGPHPELPHELWRMHVITPDARALVEALARRVAELGVEIRGDWTVDRLELEDGRVAGVSGPRGTVLARCNVVLASGDFSAPGRLEPVRPEGSELAFRPWSSGDGQLMARAVGAQITHLERPLLPQLRTLIWPYIEPAPTMFTAGAILVDRYGRRVVDECNRPGPQLAVQEDREYFLVADSSVVSRIPTAADDSEHARDAWLRPGKLYFATFPGCAYAYVDDLVRAGYGAVGDSLEPLAERFGIDGAGLVETLHQYNVDVDADVPDAYGRADRGAGIRQPPYLMCGPFNVRAILGRAGLKTDDECRVLDSVDCPIPGLLAAGAAAGVTGFAYGHGYELAWAVVSGRIAGALAPQLA